MTGQLLLVEDEATLRQILTALLTDAGHHVTAAATAEEALGLMSQHHFDVVLTDKNLPGKSGLELMTDLRARGDTTRLMLITGYPSVGAAVEALDAGFLAFLVKPLRQLREAADEVARVLALPNPSQRHAGGLTIRARLSGDRDAVPPHSALFIMDQALADALAPRLEAPLTQRAADLPEAQFALAKTRFSAVVSTDLASLIEIRDRLADAAMVFCGDASFADVLELIRLGAALMPLPGPLEAP